MKPIEQKSIQQPTKTVATPKKQDFQYISKFKSAIYASILFIVLSHKVAYKVLDLIIKVFTHNVEVIDENDNPLMLGTFIFAVLIAIVVFIF